MAVVIVHQTVAIVIEITADDVVLVNCLGDLWRHVDGCWWCGIGIYGFIRYCLSGGVLKIFWSMGLCLIVSVFF